MEMDIENEKVLVLDWMIKNFSCWNCEIHEVVIDSSKSATVPNFWMELSPRGPGGLGDHLVVRICCEKPWTFSGDLSYIGSDGSPLFTQQVHSQEELIFLELPPGPEFEKVVAQIRENEDRLTLQYRERQECNTIVYMKTSIDKVDESLKISSKLLDLAGTNTTLDTLFKFLFTEDMTGMILIARKDQTHNPKLSFFLETAFLSEAVLVRTHVAVINSDDEVKRTKKDEHLFREIDSWNFFDSLEREMTEEQFSFNLRIEFIPSKEYRHHPQVVALNRPNILSYCTTPGSTLKNPTNTLAKDLCCLYQDQDFSDFQLKCGGALFPVHRAILSARSPVFKAMLSTDMAEAASGEVVIEDLDPSTLALFLTFLYAGTVEDMQSDGALKLYYAADKYQVPSLKRECVSVLRSSVTVSNVCDLLSFAVKHQDDQLTSASHDFILENFNEVLSSEEYTHLMRSEPLLIAETVTRLAKKYVKKSDTA